MLRKLLAVVAALFMAGFMAGAAQAEWREASTRNFIVYSDGNDADLRAFADKLERFDHVLRRVHRVTAPPSPNRLRVILVQNQLAVAQLNGRPNSRVAGYYIRDARGMMMVGSRNRSGGRTGIDGESVLLHEYTHHFMYQYFPATYPTWYSEGFAEFWGATRFLAGGVVEIGGSAEHRFGSFFMNRWLPVRALLTAQNYSQVSELDLLYAQGWLLVRYAWGNPERQRQLQRYLTLVNDGASYGDAAAQAFGDLDRLNSELRAYAGRVRFDVVRLPFRTIDVGEIRTRALGPAEQALFNAEIQLSQGVSNAEFAQFATGVRQTAARFPQDPYALRLLAEVERIANQSAAADAAVDRLLTVAPNDPRGMMHRGMLRIDALRNAGGGSAADWSAARRTILRATELSPADPLLFEAYYDSFVAKGETPPDEAQAALYRALQLAPSDTRLRYKVASDFEQRGMIPEAIAIIRVDAFRAPARDEETERQRERRERLEDRYRRAGARRAESAREMLDRLRQRQRPAAAAATGG